MATKTVTPRPGLFPDGTAVAAFPKYACEVERREKRVPLPAPTDTGVIENGSVDITGDPGEYVLFGVVDEVVSVQVKAKKGNFKLIFGGETTAAIKYNATAAEVREALEALTGIGAGNVEVTGGPGDENGTKPYSVKFVEELAGTNVGAITADASELSEGTKTVTISVTKQGSPGTEGETVTCLFTIDKE